MNTASPTIEQTGSRKTRNPDNGAALPSPGLHTYAVVVACATFLLIIAGGLVKSTGSSLAVPDWPLAFGQWFPKMEGGVLYEHGHRMIAGSVGLLTFVLAGWLRVSKARPTLRYLGLGAALAVCAQAILGGVTVLYRLPFVVSLAHSCLAQIFFCLTVSIAVLSGPAASPVGLLEARDIKKLQRLGLMTIGFIFLQLIAGAVLRHTGKGLHAHLLGAFLVAVHVQLTARRVLKIYSFRSTWGKWAVALPILVAAQLVLGYFSWKTGPIPATTAHVAIGALLLGSVVAMTLQAFRSEEFAR